MNPEYYIFLSAPSLTQSENTIKIASSEGDFLGNLVKNGEGGLFGPDGLGLIDGELYVGTVVNADILKYDAYTGKFIEEVVSRDEFINSAQNDFPVDAVTPITNFKFGNLGTATGMTVGPDEHLYVSNFESKTGIAALGQPIIYFDVQDSVLVFDKNGNFIKNIEIPIDGTTPLPNIEGTINPDPNGIPDISNFLSSGQIPRAALPVGLRFGPDEDLYISARLHDQVYRYDPDTEQVSTFIEKGVGGLDGPSDILFDNNLVYVTSLDNNKILVYDNQGNFVKTLGDYTNTELLGPTAMHLTPDGESLIVTGYTSVSTVRVNLATGAIEQVLTGPVLFDENGNPRPETIQEGLTWGFLRNDGLRILTPEEIGGNLVFVDIQGEPTNTNANSVFDVTFEFSEDVAGFELGDITVTNSTVSNFQGIDENTYTATISPNGQGDITINVNQEVATSTQGIGNIGSETASVVLNRSLYVSNVNNTFGTGAVVNISLDDSGNIASVGPNFEPGVYYSSILEYDAVTGDFLGDFVPQGSANRDGIFLSSGITFQDNILYANDQGFQVDSSVTNPEDSLYGRILKFDATTGQYLGEFISGTDLTANGLNFPEDLLFGTDGDLYISGLGGGGVQKFDGTTGAYEETIIETNPFTGTDLIAAGLNFGPDGNLYISSVLNDNSIIRYDLDTGSIDQFVPSEIAPQIPSGSAFTPDGSLFLDATFVSLDGSPVGVYQYNGETGEDEGFFVNPDNNGGIQSVSRMKFDANGNLYLSDFNGSQIGKFDSAGNPVDGGIFVASGVGGLKNPGGIAFYPTSTIANRFVSVEVIAPSNVNVNSAFSITVEFNEDVNGFEIEDILAENGIVENFDEINANTYTATIIPNGNGNITIDIPRGVASSSLGNINSESATTSVIVNAFEGAFVIANAKNLDVDYQPQLANPEGDGFTDYDARGFRRIYTPGLSNILRYDADGYSVLIPAGLEDENITMASGLALGPDRLLYINDEGTNSVKKFTLEGEFVGYFLNGTTPDTPQEIVIGDDGDGSYSVYVTSLTGEGVKRYDLETGEELFHIETALNPSNPDAIRNSDGTVSLSAAIMEFDADGDLYIGSVFSDNSILKYDPDTNEVTEFIDNSDSQVIPSGIAFDENGNLYNGTFSSDTFGFPPSNKTTVAQYDQNGNLINDNFVDNSTGELNVSSRVKLFDVDNDGIDNFFVSNFFGNNIMSYQGPSNVLPGASEGVFIPTDDILKNPAGLIYLSESELPSSSFSPMYRFKNTSYSTGAYLFVGEAEKNAIIANPSYNQTFKLEGDGNPAFQANLTPKDDLMGFYRLRSEEDPGTYLYVGSQEYNSIFSANSGQQNKWVKEGLDNNGNDIPEFYAYGVGANEGIKFNRFQNKENGAYLFAGPAETTSILNNPSFANAFTNQGGAFEALV